MISTGNDIVALKGINRQRTNHFRFYSKILSVSEQELYFQEGFAEMPFEKYVWLLWSIKESIYKYQKRVLPDLVFSPAKISIREINPPYSHINKNFAAIQWENKNCESHEELYQCVIHFESEIFYSRSKICDDLIASVVHNNDTFKDVWWGIKSINHTDYENQSKEVRIFILNRLNFMLQPNYNQLSIAKNRLGCPVVLMGNTEMNIPVSLAHHDQFVAYSFLFKHPLP